MSSTHFTTEPPGDPFTPVSEVAQWLTSATLHVVLGILAGLLATGFMRHRQLHWTWAACAFSLAVLAHPLLGAWATTLGVGALCAVARGRHLHRDDLLAGGDLAEIAGARIEPLAALRGLSRRLRQCIWSSPPRQVMHDERVVVGRAGGELVSIPFGTLSGGRHTLVVGATGSGKTVTETWIATCAIEAGMGAVVVDPKGDSHMREQLVHAGRSAGRPVFEWTPRGPSVYNPFGHGTASELADKALAGERFTEPHYQRQAQRYLGHVVRALRNAGRVVSLPALVRELDPACLEDLIRGLAEQESQATFDYLESLTARQRADLAGMRDRLAIMVESDVAPWLDPSTSGAPTFELLGAVRERAVVYFSLEADAWPLLAHMLGVAIVQDLQSTVAALQGSPVPTVVVIDEFSAIAAERVAHLFGRARSAGINLLLGTQELADLRLGAHSQLLERILGNLSSLLAHRQVVPESAEMIARLAGNRATWRTSQSSDGRWTRTRSTEPLLAVEDIRGLPPGHAAAIDLSTAASPSIVEVFPSTSNTTAESFR
jgi:hypothetical protein